MSKSRNSTKKYSNTTLWDEEDDDYSIDDYREQKKQKRLKNALRSKNVHELLELDEEWED
jgi:hypothetical protein